MQIHTTRDREALASASAAFGAMPVGRLFFTSLRSRRVETNDSIREHANRQQAPPPRFRWVCDWLAAAPWHASTRESPRPVLHASGHPHQRVMGSPHCCLAFVLTESRRASCDGLRGTRRRRSEARPPPSPSCPDSRASGHACSAVWHPQRGGRRCDRRRSGFPSSPDLGGLASGSATRALYRVSLLEDSTGHRYGLDWPKTSKASGAHPPLGLPM